MPMFDRWLHENEWAKLGEPLTWREVARKKIPKTWRHKILCLWGDGVMATGGQVSHSAAATFCSCGFEDSITYMVSHMFNHFTHSVADTSHAASMTGVLYFPCNFVSYAHPNGLGNYVLKYVDDLRSSEQLEYARLSLMITM